MLDPIRTNASQRKKAKCPICGKPQVQEFLPFCSKRCRDIDLHRWLGEGYRIETDEAPDPNDTPRE